MKIQVGEQVFDDQSGMWRVDPIRFPEIQMEKQLMNLVLTVVRIDEDNRHNIKCIRIIKALAGCNLADAIKLHKFAVQLKNEGFAYFV